MPLRKVGRLNKGALNSYTGLSAPQRKGSMRACPPSRAFRKGNLVSWSWHVWGTSRSGDTRRPNQSSGGGVRPPCASRTRWGKALAKEQGRDSPAARDTDPEKFWACRGIFPVTPLVPD